MSLFTLLKAPCSMRILCNDEGRYHGTTQSLTWHRPTWRGDRRLERRQRGSLFKHQLETHIFIMVHHCNIIDAVRARSRFIDFTNLHTTSSSASRKSSAMPRASLPKPVLHRCSVADVASPFDDLAVSSQASPNPRDFSLMHANSNSLIG